MLESGVNSMGMTGRQYQAFIRLLKIVTDGTIEKSKNDPDRPKEEMLNDLIQISEILQDMLEDGN